MAARASRKLLRDFLFKRACAAPVASARHCSSAAQTAPKIPHFSKKVRSLSLSLPLLFVANSCRET